MIADQEYGCPLPGIMPSMANRRGAGDWSGMEGRARHALAGGGGGEGGEVETEGLRGRFERAQPRGLALELVEKRVGLRDEGGVAFAGGHAVPGPVRGAGGEGAPPLLMQLNLHAAMRGVELERRFVGLLELVEGKRRQRGAVPGGDVASILALAVGEHQVGAVA